MREQFYHWRDRRLYRCWVLSGVFEVSNTLGAGFLEKVNQRALLREVSLRNIRATTEVSFTVMYKGESVGE